MIPTQDIVATHINLSRVGPPSHLFPQTPLPARPLSVYTYTRPPAAPVFLLHPASNCFDCLFLDSLSSASDRVDKPQRHGTPRTASPACVHALPGHPDLRLYLGRRLRRRRRPLVFTGSPFAKHPHAFLHIPPPHPTAIEPLGSPRSVA